MDEDKSTKRERAIDMDAMFRGPSANQLLERFLEVYAPRHDWHFQYEVESLIRAFMMEAVKPWQDIFNASLDAKPYAPSFISGFALGTDVTRAEARK